MSQPKIVILGGGLAGLTIAQGLKTRSIPYFIYSKAMDRPNYNLEIRQQAINALQKTLAKELMEKVEKSEPQERTTFYQLDGNLNELMTIKKDLNDQDRLHCFEYKNIIKLLEEGVDINEAKDIKSISINPISIEYVDGSKLECDILIVADGAKSQGRKLVFGEELKCHDYSLLVGNTPICKVGSNELVAKLETGPVLVYGDGIGVYLSKYKFKDGKESLSWYLSCPSKSVEQFNSDILEIATGLDEKVLNILKNGVDIKVKPVSCVDGKLKDKLLALENRKIIFAGDSAHAMTPFKGMGGNTAFEDAADVVECITRYIKGGAQDEGMLKNCTVAIADRGFSRLGESIKACGAVHAKGWFAQTARNTVLRGVNKVINFRK